MIHSATGPKKAEPRPSPKPGASTYQEYELTMEAVCAVIIALQIARRAGWAGAEQGGTGRTQSGIGGGAHAPHARVQVCSPHDCAGETQAGHPSGVWWDVG